MTRDEEFEMLRTLEGLVTPELGEELYRLAAKVPSALAVVEIGSFKGMSTCYLAAGRRAGMGAIEMGKVWAVDPWDLPANVDGKHGFKDPSVRATFEHQVSKMGLAEWVVPTQGFSRDVAKLWGQWEYPPVGMLYIDGDHAERSVLDDFYAWEPFLVPGAVVAFDDYGTRRNPGVKIAVRKLSALIDPWPPMVKAERLAVTSYRGNVGGRRS